jgi:hypothetical protein
MSEHAESHDRDNHLIHHRNRLAGLWAAELLGLFGHAATDYVHAVMHPGHSPDTPHGDDEFAVEAKLFKDLSGRVSLSEIRSRMARYMDEAKSFFQGRR